MDLEVIETGNGGDIVKTAKDLSVVDGHANMIYLAMFGGNPGAPTPQRRVEGEQEEDWWGNTLLMPNNPDQQFNSLTEETLRTVALNSEGRLKIERAVLKDLAFLNDVADEPITVSVSIVATDEVEIKIRFIEKEVGTNIVITIGTGNGDYFDISFDISFE